MAHSIAPTLSLVLITMLTAGAPLAADDPPQPEELFRTLDSNGDGILSADEIGEPQRQAFERLLRVGDADKDGRLSREEYITGLQPDPPAGTDAAGRGPGRDGRPQRPDFGRLFDLADRDGDGKIALADLPEPVQERMRPLFERLGRDQLTREDLERLGRMQRGQRAAAQPQFDDGRLFERFDDNGDDRLSREEIPELLRRRFDPLFERLDKNELTRDEFAQALRQQRSEPQDERGPGEPTRPENAGLPLMMLGRLLDTDGDGDLTVAEIDSLKDIFVESDADGDGRLTGAELRALMGRLMSREGRPVPRAGAENPRPRRPEENPRDSR